MAETPPLYGHSMGEIRRGQLRETLTLTIRERLELLDRLNSDSDRLSGIVHTGGRRREPGRARLPDVPGWSVIALDGCRPTPLANYLKALGVLRILGEQLEVDTVTPDAHPSVRVRGWWEHERFMLWSPLDQDALVDFFLHRYRPTPVLAPWNGGSGFYPKDAPEALEAITYATAERFEPYTSAIAIARGELATMNLQERPTGDRKEAFLARLRGVLPENALAWFDAATVLTADGPKYPPLLGTGGNDGRLEFTNNFMQRIAEVLDVATGKPREDAPGMLVEALYGEPCVGFRNSPIGQFAPGAAGGPNASSGFSGEPRVNPWDYILMLEGAVLFAARAARRLEGVISGHLAFPFTVRSVGAGSGAMSTGDESDARAESWVPLWERPTTSSEVVALLGEGRVSVGRRTAGDGLDFVRSVAKLGSDRGIESFQRYGFLMRSGRAYLATPLGRIEVRRNPAADLIDDLDKEQWLSRFRSLARDKDSPARLLSLARRLDDALFTLAEGRSEPIPPAQSVLVLLGQVQDYLSKSLIAQDRIQPVPHLRDAWFERANDESDEFQLAAALAGIGARQLRSGGGGQFLLPMISNLWPLRRLPERGRVRHRWEPESGNRAVWGAADLNTNLAAVLKRRLFDAEAECPDDLPLDSSRAVDLRVMSRFLARRLDDVRTIALLKGLTFLTPPFAKHAKPSRRVILPAAFVTLKPLFTTHRQLDRISRIAAVEGRVLPRPTRVARLLSAGRIRDALDEGARLLRPHGFSTIGTRIDSRGVNGPSLLSSLITPLYDSELSSLLYPLNRRSDIETKTQHNPETVS